MALNDTFKAHLPDDIKFRGRHCVTHGVQMDRRAYRPVGRWAVGKVCLGCISEILRCRKLILGRDIG